MAAIAIMLVGVCCMSSSVGGTAFGLGFIPGTLPKLASDLKLNELKKALKYGKSLLPDFRTKVMNASASSNDERLEFIDSIDDAKCRDITERIGKIDEEIANDDGPVEVLTLSGMKFKEAAIHEFIDVTAAELAEIGTMCGGALQPQSEGDGEGEGEEGEGDGEDEE